MEMLQLLGIIGGTLFTFYVICVIGLVMALKDND